MRSEEEMMALIMEAAEHPAVRAAGMNGSRVNPEAPKDRFMDYDVAFIVEDLSVFTKETSWLERFGERTIMQMPDAMSLGEGEKRSRFSFLMLFEDGNRIDLTLVPEEEKEQYFKEDSLTVCLLDKDSGTRELPSPSDRSYWIRKPSLEEFSDCCNEFWWVSVYAAKGLWRKEMLYALDHLAISRAMLIKMLEWSAGIRHHFSISTGKNGKYLEDYTDRESWERLMKAYPSGSIPEVWRALQDMADLFEDTARLVSEQLVYPYNQEEASKVKRHLTFIRSIRASRSL
ncbi:aminoglycoside 6-adenylyltransferase [Bacillus mangrovi]|uniref:Aminoglycoside 6-adenylyltransferase n=1 Tax=Metabacillus mangrovi TaxID=1491830 RepID=A0A7X2S7G0_9BACI|nr:aminoglycoside 6-adenylyltransferase [Metabacillus mangrovi]MTH55084.1 aminoglycoside 6-adenylyltransferase [Metabacillus mangrovi]